MALCSSSAPARRIGTQQSGRSKAPVPVERAPSNGHQKNPNALQQSRSQAKFFDVRSQLRFTQRLVAFGKELPAVQGDLRKENVMVLQGGARLQQNPGTVEGGGGAA